MLNSMPCVLSPRRQFRVRGDRPGHTDTRTQCTCHQPASAANRLAIDHHTRSSPVFMISGCRAAACLLTPLSPTYEAALGLPGDATGADFINTLVIDNTYL